MHSSTRFVFVKYFLPFIFLLSSLGNCEQTQNKILELAGERKLWMHRQWLLLGHYRKTFRGYKSEVDEPSFFLAPDGKTNPRAELDATLRLFLQSADVPPSARGRICRYPARFEWIQQELDPEGTELIAPSCPETEEWIRRLNAKSLTLVFASAFLNSPASMYGHTFLRADRVASNKESSSLLSYSINFAADANDTNGFLFAFKGLFGGYPGRFTTVPYYMKLQTYSNIESRDLWEYRLSLNEKEIRTLLNHLWEMGDAYFDYYFTNENCSFQLLPLLEVARPDLNLSRKFWLRAIPIDTVRSLYEAPELIVERTVRRSALRKMTDTRGGLSARDIKAAELIAVDPLRHLPGALDPVHENQRGKVMQAAYQYFRYRRGFSRYQDEKSDEQERKILQAISQSSFLQEPEVQDGSDEDDPAMGHRSARLGFAAGQREDRWVGEISIRPAFHDFMDNPQGYVPHNRLEMLNLALRYGDASEKIFIRQFTLLDILSLSPLDRWVQKPSWGVRAGLDSRRDARDQSWDASYFHLNTNSGLSFSFPALGREAMIYALGQMDTGAGPAFEKKFRIGPGILSGAAVEFSRRFRLQGEADYRHYIAGDKGGMFGFRLIPAISLSRNAQLRFTYEQEESIREFLLSLYLYL